MTETLYKVLHDDGASHIGTGIWHLPTQDDNGEWMPGEWMPEVENPVLCERGYHGTRAEHLFTYLSYGLCIYEMEAEGIVWGDDKFTSRRARLTRSLAWGQMRAALFAADCAEHVLHMYEAEHPDDSRPRNCIEVIRRYVAGDAARSEVLAARDAAVAADAAASAYAAAAAAYTAAANAANAAAAYTAAYTAAAYAAYTAAAYAADAAAAYTAADAAAAANAAANAAAAAYAAADAAADASAYTADASAYTADAYTADAAAYAADAAARRQERTWQTERLMDYLYGRVKLPVKEASDDSTTA